MPSLGAVFEFGWRMTSWGVGVPRLGVLCLSSVSKNKEPINVCGIFMLHFHLISVDLSGSGESQRCQALARPEELLCFGWESRYEHLLTDSVFSPKFYGVFLRKFSSGATMISSALSRPRRPQGTQGTRSMAPKTCDFCRQEGSLDVPGITSKLQQNIVQCPPSCSWVHMVWAFNDFKRDQVMLSWVWSVKNCFFFLPALLEHGKLHCKEKH